MSPESHPAARRLISYLTESPTPLHAVAAAVRRLEAAGYTALDLADAPGRLAVGSKRYVARDGTLLAFRVGRGSVAEAGFRVVAAHTDSPNLRIKPQPVLRGHGYVRLGVEPYGGLIQATWTDRDLGIAGGVQVREGSTSKRLLVDIRRPLCRIPNLAIHINRGVNDEGLKLNAQSQLPAVFALGDDKDERDPLRAVLAEALSVESSDILTWDLSLFDLTEPTLAGANEEFVHSARLDNLASCHAGLEGLLAAGERDVPASTAILALFDHEEIGSRTSRGADGRLIEDLLQYVHDNAETSAPGGLTRASARSWLVSADMAHAVHPAHVDKHDTQHMPRLNAGPVIKQNVNHRYATEGETSAMFLLLCQSVDAPVQWFVNRSDLACGSTVGPMLAARLGMPGVDVGNPMLSMHSAREMSGAADHGHLVRVLGAFFTDRG